MKPLSAITIDDVVNHCFEDSFFKGYSSSFYHNDKMIGEDIFQEFLLIVLRNEKRMIELYHKKHFNYYSASIIKNLVYYKSSVINKNKFFNDEIGYSDMEYIETESNSNFEKLDDILIRLNDYLLDYVKTVEGGWYDYELYKLYFIEKHSLRDISKLTRIPTTSIHLSIFRIKKLLKDKFGEEYDIVRCKQRKNNNF